MLLRRRRGGEKKKGAAIFASISLGKRKKKGRSAVRLQCLLRASPLMEKRPLLPGTLTETFGDEKGGEGRGGKKGKRKEIVGKRHPRSSGKTTVSFEKSYPAHSERRKKRGGGGRGGLSKTLLLPGFSQVRRRGTRKVFSRREKKKEGETGNSISRRREEEPRGGKVSCQ